jgi:hypothetical protein
MLDSTMHTWQWVESVRTDIGEMWYWKNAYHQTRHRTMDCRG